MIIFLLDIYRPGVLGRGLSFKYTLWSLLCLFITRQKCFITLLTGDTNLWSILIVSIKGEDAG